MTVEHIVALIEARQKEHFDRQIVGTASDPLIFTEAGHHWAVAEEYGSLLKEIADLRGKR